MIKLIATDIDGTLLETGKTMPDPRYYDVIGRLLADGVSFCVSSGRQYASQSKLFGPYMDQIFNITENGARVLYGQKELFCSVMTKEDSVELVKDTRALGSEAECMYCTRDTAYFSPLDHNIQEMMTRKFLFRCQTVDRLEDLPFPCIKYSIKIRDSIEEGLRDHFIPKWQKTHEVTRGGNYISVMEKGVTKGSAIKRIQDYLGLSPEETMVFGDNRNDLEMMKEASWGVAVANARPLVKEAARIVTASNDDLGVLKIMEALIRHHYQCDQEFLEEIRSFCEE